jgi:LEA14-like dessication related protein
MKRKVRRRIVLTGILVIGFLAVIFYYLFNPGKALNLILPGLNEINYAHIDLKKDSALVKLFVFIQNKMPYKMAIDTFYFEIKLNGIKIIEETVPTDINLSWRDTDTIKLPANISLKQTSKIISDLNSQDSTELEASIYVVYKTIIGRQKININRKTRIATPIPPQITILKLEHKKYNMKDKSTDAVLKIEIINKGKNLDLRLNSVSYNLQIKNTLFSKGTLAGPIDIKPGSSQTVNIPIVIEYSNPIKTAWAIVTDNDMLKYDINVKTDVILYSFNTDYLIPVEVDATGYMELVK